MITKKISFIYTILTLFIIIISEDSYLFGTNINESFILLRYALYCLISVFAFNYIFKTLDLNIIRYILVIIASLLVCMIVNQDFRNGYAIQILTIITAAKLASVLDFYRFSKYVSNIIYILSIISTILYFICIVFPPIIDVLPKVYNSEDKYFASIVIANIYPVGEYIRASSIFREPGVFGFYITFALAHFLFFENKIQLFRIIILGIALITTYSTGAIFAVVLLLIAYYFNNIKSNRSLLILPLIIICILCYPIIAENTFSKIDSQNSNYLSTLSRIASTTIPLEMFSHKILGVGISEFPVLYEIYSSKQYGIKFSTDGESTNTILNSFAIYGIFYGIIIIFAIVALAKRYSHSIIIFSLIFAFFIFSFSTQELRLSLFYNVILIFGIQKTYSNEQKEFE